MGDLGALPAKKGKGTEYDTEGREVTWPYSQGISAYWSSLPTSRF